MIKSIKWRSLCAVLFVLIAECAMAKLTLGNCTLKEHLKYKYTECNQERNTANVFFYYDSKDLCDLRPGKSEALPPFMQEVPCNHLCTGDGYFTNIVFNDKKEPELACQKCAANEIAIRGGFVYDPKMEKDHSFPNSKENADLAHFSTSCFTINMIDVELPLKERMS